jgi:hypothetical protein
MRKSLLVVFVLIASIFTAVLIIAILTVPSPSGPDRCVALIPALMLADYYTTLTYAWLAKRTNKTADLASMELNPLWKAAVARLRVVNIPFFMLVAFSSVLYLFLSPVGDGSGRSFFLVLLGLGITVSGVNVARNVLNIALLIRAEHLLPASDRTGARRWLASESAQSNTVRLAVLVVLVSSALYVSGWFVLGGAAGLIFERALRKRWIYEAAVSRRIVLSEASKASDAASTPFLDHPNN